MGKEKVLFEYRAKIYYYNEHKRENSWRQNNAGESVIGAVRKGLMPKLSGVARQVKQRGQGKISTKIKLSRLRELLS